MGSHVFHTNHHYHEIFQLYQTAVVISKPGIATLYEIHVLIYIKEV